MTSPEDQEYRAIPYARSHYESLCKKHKACPTPVQVDVIKRTNDLKRPESAISDRFEPALLFFLPKSAVRFEHDALLVGWTRNYDGSELEVWFKICRHNGWFCHTPSILFSPVYCPEGVACTRWHPAVLDIINPDNDSGLNLQGVYFMSLIKLIKATIPPPCIESLGQSRNDLTSTALPMAAQTIPDIEERRKHEAANTLVDPKISDSASWADPDREPGIKPQATVGPATNVQVLRTRLGTRMQALRDALEKKEVLELKQILNKRSELPPWIKEFVEQVLLTKMIQELELAESLLL